jgi:aromatic-L-amino-acid/L-tryptophan decarboxylase
MPRTVVIMSQEGQDRTSFSWHPEPELIAFIDPLARVALHRLGRRTWDLALDYLYEEALRRPVGPDSYPESRQRIFGPSGRPGRAPTGPSTSGEVLEEIRNRLMPYLFNAHHPASFSYFTTPPLPMSIAGEVLAQWFHQSVDVFHAGPAAALIEEEVTGWLRDLVGFDEHGWGVLTSGGVMANIMAMMLARDVHLAGVRGLDRPPRGPDLARGRIYASDQAHFSIARALDVLGFPRDALRVIGSDERFRLRAGPVADAIAEDRAARLVPFCISAVSGSTNTGSVDLVAELADLAEQEGLWLHVDAAYGGAARLSARDAGRVRDLDRADSVTIDPHKWFYQAFDLGALIVRRRDDLHRTFLRSPEYYRSTRPQDQPLNWMEYSLEGTRRFRGLKLWASWKHLGTEGLGRLIEANNDMAALLARKIRESDDFEALPEDPELSVVCFRHLPGGREAALQLDPDALDRHQDVLQRALEVSGEAWVSTTRLRGRTYLRAGVVNHLTSETQLDELLAALRRLSPVNEGVAPKPVAG